jgi:hypothetical protein
MLSGRRRTGRSPTANEIEALIARMAGELLKGGNRFWTDDAPLVQSANARRYRLGPLLLPIITTIAVL